MGDNIKVSLKGKTAKGKQRVKRDGADWFIIWVKNDPPQFSPSDSGPWWFIGSEKTSDSRWVRSTNDPDFEVEVK